MCVEHCEVVSRHVPEEQSALQLNQWVDHWEERWRTYRVVVDMRVLEDL